MGEFLDALPIVAAAFAIPQFLPQIRKLRRTGDTAGVSWPWAMLTSVSNGAWVGYFALSASWAALVPASSATLLAGALAVMLARRGRSTAQPAVLIGAWAALLAIAFTVAGRGGLGDAAHGGLRPAGDPVGLDCLPDRSPYRDLGGNLAPDPRRAVVLDELRRPQG